MLWIIKIRSLFLSDIKRGHKIAITPINKGENIIKYGFPLGHATQNIKKGEHVHTHNVKTNLEGMQEYSFTQKLHDSIHKKQNLTFQGYRRENGDVGIRNELWIIPTVGCVNGMADRIIEVFKQEVQPEGLDSITVFKHNYGCSQLGDDHENTKTILGIWFNILMQVSISFGLGCENNVLDVFRESLGEYNPKRVKF